MYRAEEEERKKETHDAKSFVSRGKKGKNYTHLYKQLHELDHLAQMGRCMKKIWLIQCTLNKQKNWLQSYIYYNFFRNANVWLIRRKRIR